MTENKTKQNSMPKKKDLVFRLKIAGITIIMFAIVIMLIYSFVKPVSVTIIDLDDIDSYSHYSQYIDRHCEYVRYACLVLGVTVLLSIACVFETQKTNDGKVAANGICLLLGLTIFTLCVFMILNSFLRFDFRQAYALLEVMLPEIKTEYVGGGIIISPYVGFAIAAVGYFLIFIGGLKGTKIANEAKKIEEEQIAEQQRAEEQAKATQERNELVQAIMQNLAAQGITPTHDTVAATINNVTHSEQEPAVEETTLEEPSPIEAQPLEYIAPKISDKGKKGIMIALIVSYVLLAIAAVLFVSVSSMGSILVSVGMVEQVQSRAYAISIGMIWFAVLPSIGYYFATISPYSLDKKKRIIIFVVCGTISVVVVLIYFILIYTIKINGYKINDYYASNDIWFLPLSIVFAVIAIMICYILTLFKLNPEAIRVAKPQKESEGFFAMMKHLLAEIIYGIKKMVKKILIFKEKEPDVFILILSLGLTWFVYFMSFVVAIIALCILFVVIAMIFSGMIEMSYSVNRPSVKKIEIFDGTSYITLTYNSVLSYGDREIYEDSYGNMYSSYDHGKTVIKE